MEKKIYEANGNVYLSSLKCTMRKGARVTMEDGMLIAAGNSVPASPEFSVLLNHGMFRELTNEEAETPEHIEEQKVRKSPERLRMEVQEVEDRTSPLKITGKEKKEQPSGAKRITSMKELQVIKQQSSAISSQVKNFSKSNKVASAPQKKKLTKEELQEVENRKKERLAKSNSGVVPYETPKEIADVEKKQPQKETSEDSSVQDKRLAALEKAREAKRLKAEQSKKPE